MRYALSGMRYGLAALGVDALEFKAPGRTIRLSLCLTGLWTYVQHTGNTHLDALEFKAPGRTIRLSLCLTGLWTYVQHTGNTHLTSVLVEVQAASKLVVMQTFIVAD